MVGDRTMRRQEAFRGRRMRSDTAVASLFVPRLPSVPFVGFLTSVLALVATFYAPDVDLEGTPPHIWIWLASNIASAMTMTLSVWVLVKGHRIGLLNRRGIRVKRVLLVAGLLAGASAASVVRAEMDGALEWEGYVHRFGFMFWAGAVSYVAVALAGNIYVNLVRSVDDQQRALRNQVAEISRTRTLVARADEAVRRNVAELLHGPVQSRLLATEMRLELLAASSSADLALRAETTELAGILRDLREQEVRPMSHQLHPPAIRVGLVVAVRSLIARLEGQFMAQVHLDLTDDVIALDDPVHTPVPEQVRLTVYRAIEESVTNAIRHGAASELWVQLERLPGARLALRVDDDGAGLPAVASKVGLGLASVAARAESRNGTWSLRPGPRGGARLEMVLPFRGEDIGESAPVEPSASRRRRDDRRAEPVAGEGLGLIR
jgi:signal transduction histidine kinase